MRFGQSLAGVRLVIPDHPMGLPVLRALSLCTCCRHYPGAATGRRRRSSHPAVSAFPDNVVGSTCTSSFSRIARRSLALRPAHARGHLYVTCYTEGFSHFVSSMTAPVASGWSGCRVGLSPTGKRRLLTAHTSSGHRGRGRGKRASAAAVIRVLSPRTADAIQTINRGRGRKRDLTTTGAMQRWTSIRLHSISRGGVRRSWRLGDRLCG